ncbi:MAG: hypothetical protein IT380_24740 [Myxococcales bacterium]|nr:hypothetical protein [Myxococcales bacterium]
MPLPPCGLYRTTRPLGELPAGRLVYFHNHGDPSAGVYLPGDWKLNRASWQPRGHTIPDEAWAQSLAPLPAEGLYRVSDDFFCCEKQCVRFPKSQLVQLGYDGEANAILFVPEWTSKGLGFPERGTRLDASRLSKLEPLSVATGEESPRDSFVH